jgi:hypothetical protein
MLLALSELARLVAHLDPGAETPEVVVHRDRTSNPAPSCVCAPLRDPTVLEVTVRWLRRRMTTLVDVLVLT